MNNSDIINIVAGCLEVAVACFALRLNRLFGAPRVGWSLFGAFSLMALLSLVQSFPELADPRAAGLQIDMVYLLVPALLITGMVHLEQLLKAHLQLEGEMEHAREGL